MKKDQTPKPAKGTQRKKIEGEAADPRKALFAAIQSRGTNDDDSSPKPTPVDPRQALFAAIKNKGADASTASTPGANVKYSRGVKRLESFIWKAEASLSLTERDQSAALRACKVSMVILYIRIDNIGFRRTHTSNFVIFLLQGSCGLLWRGRRREICLGIAANFISFCIFS